MYKLYEAIHTPMIMKYWNLKESRQKYWWNQQEKWCIFKQKPHKPFTEWWIWLRKVMDNFTYQTLNYCFELVRVLFEHAQFLNQQSLQNLIIFVSECFFKQNEWQMIYKQTVLQWFQFLELWKYPQVQAK